MPSSDCNLESYHRDKSNKQPKQATCVAIIYIYEAGYDSLFDAVLSNV